MPHNPRDHSARRQAQEAGSGSSHRQKVFWIAIGVAVLVVFVVLHLTGVVGSETNGEGLVR